MKNANRLIFVPYDNFLSASDVPSNANTSDRWLNNFRLLTNYSATSCITFFNKMLCRTFGISFTKLDSPEKTLQAKYLSKNIRYMFL